MNYTVTLESLRRAGACFEGYNRVVRSIQGRNFTNDDAKRESYIKFSHAEPITLIAILKSNSLDDALWSLSCVPDVDRDARLFAVWCARQVESLMTDQRSKDALNVAERFANGEAAEEELSVARAAALDARAAGDAARAAGDAARAAGDAVRDGQKEMFIAMCEGRAPWQIKEK